MSAPTNVDVLQGALDGALTLLDGLLPTLEDCANCVTDNALAVGIRRDVRHARDLVAHMRTLQQIAIEAGRRV